MKKILIIGGAGFIGLHLAKKIIHLNYKVDIVDNFYRGSFDLELKNSLKHKNLKLLKIDLLKNNSEKKIKNDYYAIFHLAAIVGVKNVINRPYSVLFDNLNLTTKAITIAKKQKKLNKFFFASTSEIYSKSIEKLNSKIPTPENVDLLITDPSDKRSTYFLSKIYGESLVHHSKLPFIIFRPHNIYGPRMGQSHVIPEIVLKFLKAKKNITAFSASHTRSFCYIDDAVDQLVFLLKSKIVNNTFNLGNQKEEITISYLIKKIKHKMGKKNVKINFKKDNHGSQNRRCPNMLKLKSFYNFKLTTLELGLDKTIQWYTDYGNIK